MATEFSVNLITPQDLSKELGVGVQTLCNWRSNGRHPLPFIKCGRLVRYRREDVQAFVAERMVTPTAKTEGAHP